MRSDDDRLVVIIGPCSIHDPKAAMEYAEMIIANSPGAVQATKKSVLAGYEALRTEAFRDSMALVV